MKSFRQLTYRRHALESRSRHECLPAFTLVSLRMWRTCGGLIHRPRNSTEGLIVEKLLNTGRVSSGSTASRVVAVVVMVVVVVVVAVLLLLLVVVVAIVILVVVAIDGNSLSVTIVFFIIRFCYQYFPRRYFEMVFCICFNIVSNNFWSKTSQVSIT
jgi:CBS domain containing-hemolysin-like protein